MSVGQVHWQWASHMFQETNCAHCAGRTYRNCLSKLLNISPHLLIYQFLAHQYLIWTKSFLCLLPLNLLLMTVLCCSWSTYWGSYSLFKPHSNLERQDLCVRATHIINIITHIINELNYRWSEQSSAFPSGSRKISEGISCPQENAG